MGKLSTAGFKQLLSKLLLVLMQQMQLLNEYLTQNAENPNPNAFEELTPTYLSKTDSETYVNTLIWAVRSKDANNIALTGAYGSGKSSILTTFEKDHPEFNYLNISLASFDDEGQTGLELRKRIEVSILQQIFYKVSVRKVPFSRFRRIKNTPEWQFVIYAGLSIIWCLATILLFKRDVFSSLSWWQDFLKANQNTLLYFSGVLFVFGAFAILYRLIKTYSTTRFQKLNVTSGEIELAADAETSILNKHLDEILYFFEKTRYNVVILEDLDRFKDPEIFTKLRELNNLINSSSEVKRKITFIYALKDNIFTGTNRPKFFDFLIPVIPVINASNSGEKLIKKFNEAKSKGMLTDNFITDITLFIDDMRMLKNIYNEYILYKTRIGLKVDQQKLLGIIVYKNFYPEDFAELNIKKGIVFRAFHYKPELLSILQAKNSTSISELQTRNIYLKSESQNTLSELRAVYTFAILQELPAEAYQLKSDNIIISISSLSVPQNFEIFKKATNIEYNILYGNWNKIGSFTKIESKVNNEKSYDQRMAAVTAKLTGEISSNEKEIQQLQRENDKLSSKTLKELLAIRRDIGLAPEVKKEELLTYLLSRGYIDENYNNYIAYFYEGTLTRSDMDFLMSVKTGNALAVDFELSKIEQLIKRINLTEFSQKAVLNFDLLDFLSKNKNVNKEQFEIVIAHLSDRYEKDHSFLDSYLDKGKQVAIVTRAVYKEWPGLLGAIIQNENNAYEIKDKYLTALLKNADIEDIALADDNRNVSRILESRSDFLTFVEYIEVRKVKLILDKLQLEFKILPPPESPNEIFDHIYQKSYYELRPFMIHSILSANDLKDDLDEKLKIMNFSTIMASTCVPIKNYIDSNINLYLSDVFFAIETNDQEEEHYVLKLLNNTNITSGDKQTIIEVQATSYQDIQQVPKELWITLLKESKLAPDWKQLMVYFDQEALDKDVLTAYLNRVENFQILAKLKIGNANGEDKVIVKKLTLFILLNDSLTIDAYIALIKSDPHTWDSLSFEKLSGLKIEALLNKKALNFTKTNFDKLKVNFPDKHIRLLTERYSSYEAVQAEIELDAADRHLLLASDKLTLPQKIAQLKEMTSDMITSKSQSDQISHIVIGSPATHLPFDMVLKLIQKNSSNTIDVKLMLQHFADFSRNEILQLLNATGNGYKTSLVKRKKPSIPRTNDNLQLAKLLEKNEYINSYKDTGKDIILRALYK